MPNTKIDAVELTRQLIRFETVNPVNPEKDCVEYVGNLLAENGFDISYHDFAPGRTNLIARIGGSATCPPICFTGHLDTVPLGHTEWSMAPFGADIADGKLYGRGSSDMKSGVAAFVAAVIEIASDLATGPGVVLLITAGEETGCEGAAYIAGLGDVIGKAGAIVVAEPTSNYPYVGHKGALWMKAVTDGVTAHGSMPELGVNAIYKASRAITKLEDYDFNVARHPVMGPATLNVGTVDGGINVNSVPNRAEIGIDVRTIPGQDNDVILKQLASYLGDEVTLTPTVNLEPVWTSPEHPWMQSVFEVVAPLHDDPIVNKTAAYFTDASIFTRAYDFAPTVILGPGEAAMAHQTDEFCYVSRIEEAVGIYRTLAENWNNQ
ncbi:M20 family metallopeptidase [Thalassospira povalilytica]|uniref:Probable succinyl-diaminopimelate desuccinylase n=1 Tax=Thalassospira povalilytica TaxID=732237 RepID=A0A8I1MAQ3_9PROT|nr:M20 family metallopeptidase [Thalassospira povalilytica]